MAGKNDGRQWSHDQSFPEVPIKTKNQIITGELQKIKLLKHLITTCTLLYISYSKKQTIHCQ